MGSDPTCIELAGSMPRVDDVMIAEDGSLANAFVYIKSGLDPKATFEVPSSPVVLDQRGCRFVPRVLGVRVGQPLEVLNSDPTEHNVHAMPLRNAEFNRAQPVQGMRETRMFTTPEVMVRIKCDTHGWMTAYAGVLAHPFFAVTGADGGFELSEVPPGHYTVEAWHERLGTRTATAQIDGHESQQVAFTFGGN
jgi:plastocyanin